MSLLNKVRGAAAAAKAKYNATANQRAAFATRAASTAQQIGASALGYAKNLKNRLRGPGVTAAVNANTRVANAAKNAAAANKIAAKNPTAINMTKAGNAMIKLNTTMKAAIPPNNAVTRNVKNNKVTQK